MTNSYCVLGVALLKVQSCCPNVQTPKLLPIVAIAYVIYEHLFICNDELLLLSFYVVNYELESF